MAKTAEQSIETPQAYRRALNRANELRDAGHLAETSAELAALEGAIARYVIRQDEPAEDAGRSDESGRPDAIRSTDR